jgi:hypothetical protein
MWIWFKQGSSLFFQVVVNTTTNFSFITCHIYNKQEHYVRDCMERCSTYWKNLSPKKEVSSEHEKTET